MPKFSTLSDEDRNAYIKRLNFSEAWRRDRFIRQGTTFTRKTNLGSVGVVGIGKVVTVAFAITGPPISVQLPPRSVVEVSS